MDFNFDEIINRRNTDAIKWDAAPATNVLPMWVADMDFKTASAVITALQNRVAHGIFGYTQTPPEFFTAIVNWWQHRHGFAPQKEWIIPASGVIPALSALVRALVKEGSKVIIQPPVYNHFYITLKNCGCRIVENNLLYANGGYTIDFEDLETKAADPDVKMLIISNPHNPACRVWTKEELQKMGAMCLKYKVIVVSDEIHADLVYAEFKHIPFASLGQEYSQNAITLASPTKTFNLAGLQVGYLFTENSGFRDNIQKVLTQQEMELLSPFAITALIAAYNEGGQWLEALTGYLYDNYVYLKEFLAGTLPQIKVAPLEATYLVWLDCSCLSIASATLAEGLLKEQGLWVNAGTMYGTAGEGFLRVNIACPRALLQEGLNRLAAGISLA
jgi:cystathionine beta-lyase